MRISRDQVDKLFPEIIEELGYNKKRDLEWLDSLFDFLSNMGAFFKVLFVAAVIAIIIFIIYKIVINISRNGRRLKRNKKIVEDNENRKLHDVLREISKLKNQKDFTLATVLLHHATILFLLEKNYIDYNRDYTNREIFNLLLKTNLLASFKTIAIRSQGILFNNEEIDERDFLELETSYNEVFYD